MKFFDQMFRLCNADTDGETGMCVRKGLCGDKKSGSGVAYGEVLGDCDFKVHG